MNPSALVVHHDEDIGSEPPGGRRKRERGLEARTVACEQDDGAQPGLLRQRHEVVGNPRAFEADGEGVSGPDQSSFQERERRRARRRFFRACACLRFRLTDGFS